MEGGVSSPLGWPVSFEVITGWLETLRAGQWTSHARPHTFRPVSRCGDGACLDVHTQKKKHNTMTQSRHTYLDVHTQTSVQLLGHAGAHIPGKHTPNDYLPLQKQRLGCLCRCYWGRIGGKKRSPGTLAGFFSKFHAFDWQHWTPERKLECLNFRGKHKRTSRVE